MFINNLASMINAFGGQESDRHSLVILFSLCNASSRYLFGLVADKFAAQVPRAFWLTVHIRRSIVIVYYIYHSPKRVYLYCVP